MTNTDFENRIRQIEWPATSADLRARVIALAPAAPRATWSDRVWFSHTFRWSVAAALVALMTIASWPGSNAGERRPTGSVAAEANAIRDAAIEAGLPSDTAAALARRATAPRASSTSRAVDLKELVKMDGGF